MPAPHAASSGSPVTSTLAPEVMPEPKDNRSLIPKPAGPGIPPKPPKRTPGGVGEPSPEWPLLPLPDPVSLPDLATALSRKPVQIMIDLVDLGLLITLKDYVQFRDAAEIAQKYGYKAERRS